MQVMHTERSFAIRVQRNMRLCFLVCDGNGACTYHRRMRTRRSRSLAANVHKPCPATPATEIRRAHMMPLNIFCNGIGTLGMALICTTTVLRNPEETAVDRFPCAGQCAV